MPKKESSTNSFFEHKTLADESDFKTQEGDSLARQFKRWFLFSVTIAGLLVAVQSLSKIPERMGQHDIHWLFGKQSPVSYVSNRVALVLLVSTVVAFVAAFLDTKTRRKRGSPSDRK